MPDTVYLESQGVQLQRGDGASPEVLTLIPQCTSISGIGGGAPAEIDVTTLDSTAKEFAMGLKDEGEISVDLVHNPNHAQHLGLRTDRDNRTLRNFRLTLTDSPATVLDFAAYVKTFAIADAVEDVQRTSMTLRISGAVTWS